MTAPDPWRDLRAALEDGIRNHPRSLQTALGPSEIGTACDKCLVHILAGRKVTEHVVPWLPTIGTAVHTWVEGTLRRQFFAQPEGTDRRYLLEHRVTIGTIGGVPISGSLDIYDTWTKTVIDIKVTGKTTLDKVRRSGPSQTYQAQIHGYGTGLAAEGFDVDTVMIAYLPRNAVSLQHARVWTAPFSPAVTEATLARANALYAGIVSVGVDAVLAMTAPHTDAEFSCGKWADDGPSAGASSQLEGLIA